MYEYICIDTRGTILRHSPREVFIMLNKSRHQVDAFHALHDASTESRGTGAWHQYESVALSAPASVCMGNHPFVVSGDCVCAVSDALFPVITHSI